jgi:hypothetical protein
MGSISRWLAAPVAKKMKNSVWAVSTKIAETGMGVNHADFLTAIFGGLA